MKLINRHFVHIESERIGLDRLNGRILARPVLAKRDGPSFDRVAMDGIAVCFGHNPSGRYHIEDIQRAGRPAIKLKKKQNAIEVMTGAMLPTGTDTVIPYEHLSIENHTAIFHKDFKCKKRQNIHFHGSDYSKGHILLNKGVKT